jgi:hypothetical protein
MTDPRAQAFDLSTLKNNYVTGGQSVTALVGVSTLLF